MRHYINHNTGKVYSEDQLELGDNESPDENNWSELALNKHGLPELKAEEIA